jgi:ABC-type uncharacterized transport system auxiliary subunit
VRRRFLLLAPLPLLCACVSILSPQPPPVREYRLDYPPPAAIAERLPAVVRVGALRVDAAYATSAIVYRQSDLTIGTYPYHRWITDPAQLIVDMISRDLIASQAYRAVEDGPSVVRADYVLTGNLVEIEQRLEGGGSAHLEIRFLLQRIARDRSSQVLFQHSYVADEPCRGTDVSGFVAAMSRALQKISTELQGDVHTAIASDLAS